MNNYSVPAQIAHTIILFDNLLYVLVFKILDF